MKKNRKFEALLEKVRGELFEEYTDPKEMQDQREEEELEKVDDEVRQTKLKNKKEELKTLKKKNGSQL